MSNVKVQKLKVGFTLIELLIVIALLGALAIGLIGAIDPFEQLKKGQDTGTRNTVAEIHSSIIRYYALKGRMPWCDKDDTATSCDFPSATKLASMYQNENETKDGALSNIILSGELKSTFTTVQSKELEKIYVTGDFSNATVCYHPVSKSFNTDDNSVYNVSGVTPFSTCPGAESLKCHWCVN